MPVRFGVIVAAGVIASGALLAAGAAPPAAAASTGIAVSGNHFLLDGRPFVPRGFNSIALLNSPWCTTSATKAAAAAFSPAELQLAKTRWNANTLRFQVSQPVLAGPNGAAYAQQLETAVNTVLANGFVVIISMQDQSRACGPAQPLPGAQTEAAWSTLISSTQLSHDPDVMFELFNEPANQPATTATTNPKQSTWVDWLNGGRQLGPGTGWAAYVPVGHQDLVNFMRNSLNVANVLIADGANSAHRLDGVPLLNDPGPTHQIAYAIHPYYYTDGPAGWTARWGYLAATQAVLATEWDYTASGCGTAAQRMAPQLLAYQRDTVNVGVLGHALDDYTGELIADPSLTPTQCGTAHPGGGTDFLTSYMATFTPTAVAAPVVTAGAYGGYEVDLSWSAPPDTAGIAHYDVYRDGVLITSTTSTSVADTSVAPAMTYGYSVVATDTAGNVSPASTVASVTTGTGQPPAAPAGLTLTRATNTITVSWAASGGNPSVTGYRLSRNGIALITTPATTYTDSAVSQGSTYSYQIAAMDAFGNLSRPSAAVSITLPDTTKPSAPTKLTLTPAKASVVLKWSASTDNVGVKAYRVYRAGTLIATVAGPALTYTSTGLKSGTKYSFHLTAVDAARNVSAASATVSAKAR